MILPFFTVFLCFVIFLAIRYKSNSRKQQELQESFWEKEAFANSTPAVDLDSLSYITIPLEKFPLGFSSDEKIIAMEAQLQLLATKPIINLTGKTNTDLKSTYGVANLEKMMEIGDNFDQLSILLKDYAAALMEHKMFAEAIAVLEFGVGIKTDISQHYIMLGTCYKAFHKEEKIHYLIEQVSAMHLLLGPSILRQLQVLLTDEEAPVDAPEDFPIS